MKKIYRLNMEDLNKTASKVYNGHNMYTIKGGKQVLNFTRGDKVKLKLVRSTFNQPI